MHKKIHTDFEIIIEHTKGSYKSFGADDTTYPLRGVTYPVDYGHIVGYIGEDGDPLDVFVGTGTMSGFIKVWRHDVPTETKIILDVTSDEWQAIIGAFQPVLIESETFKTEKECKLFLQTLTYDYGSRQI